MPNASHSASNGAIASSNGGGWSPRWTKTRLRQQATEIGARARSSGHRLGLVAEVTGRLELAVPVERPAVVPAHQVAGGPRAGPHDDPGAVRADVVEAAQRPVALDERRTRGCRRPRRRRTAPVVAASRVVRTSPTRPPRPIAARGRRCPGRGTRRQEACGAPRERYFRNRHGGARSGHRHRDGCAWPAASSCPRATGRWPPCWRRCRTGRTTSRRRTATTYVRYVAHGFAVLRLDLRGTGSSGGIDHRRVPRRRAARPAHGDRVAGRTAVVDRPGRHVRHVVLGVQLAADGRRGRARRTRRGRGHLRHRRPLHRRRPLLRRRAAGDRPHRLPALHDRHERPAARAGGLVGDGWREELAAAHRRDAAVAARVAGAPGRRADVAARARSASARRRRLRADVVPDDARRRVGRRLPQQHVPRGRAVRAQRPAVAAARRTVGPSEPAPRPARPEHRRRRRDARLLRRAPPRRAAVGAAHGSGLRPPRRSRPEPDLADAPGVWRDVDDVAAVPALRQRDLDESTRDGVDRLDGRRRRRASRRGTRAPARCRGASRSTSAPTTPGRSTYDWPIDARRRGASATAPSRCGSAATGATATSASSSATCSPTARRR